MTSAGLPHSEISGSKDVCSSPELIAACRVLHRLPMPRHPLCALSIFALTRSIQMMLVVREKASKRASPSRESVVHRYMHTCYIAIFRIVMMRTTCLKRTSSVK